MVLRFLSRKEEKGWDFDDVVVEDVKKKISGGTGLNTESIVAKFGSIASFVLQFESFLVQEGGLNDVGRVKSIRKQRGKRDEQRSSLPNCRALSDDSICDPIADLSTLYELFRADMTGFYFLCDLEKITSLAESIDHLPLTFREKYIFCMAPVDVYNTQLLESFVSFVI